MASNPQLSQMANAVRFHVAPSHDSRCVVVRFDKSRRACPASGDSDERIHLRQPCRITVEVAELGLGIACLYAEPSAFGSAWALRSAPALSIISSAVGTRPPCSPRGSWQHFFHLERRVLEEGVARHHRFRHDRAGLDQVLDIHSLE